MPWALARAGYVAAVEAIGETRFRPVFSSDLFTLRQVDQARAARQGYIADRAAAPVPRT